MMSTNNLENKPQPSQDNSKRKLKVSFSWFISSIKTLTIDTFTVRKGADITGTVANIKKDLEFKGHSIWILIFSIFIASIGLNLNSTAVIIGAMLISPLMGPIQGIGLSLGTNDFETLVLSFRNLLIMVFVSILTSFIFFSLSPFQEAQSELLGRTKPNLFDAFVAIFGGLAGIIAGSRYERGNVIPGVAIATALMPPLCTAGYGLATHQYTYFFGAFYLFMLNSAFICITTILVVKFLRVPLVHYVNPRKERQIRVLLSVLAVVVIIPSLVTLFSVTKEYKFDHQVKSFVKNEIRQPGVSLISSKSDYNTDSLSSLEHIYHSFVTDSSCISSTLTLTLIGEPIDSLKMEEMQTRLNYYVRNTKLRFLQPKDKSYEYNQTIGELEQNSVQLEDAFNQAKQRLAFQDEKINTLTSIVDLAKQDSIPVNNLEKEVVSFYPNVEKLEAGVVRDSKKRRIHTFFIHWKSSYKDKKEKEVKQDNIKNWLTHKITSDSISIIGL